jgi:hypothetical protein
MSAPDLITLIPAYKTAYLAPLFEALAAQTHPNFRVVLGDDSEGAEVTRGLREGRFGAAPRALDLVVLPGPRQGSLKNIQSLLARAGHLAPLVHIHLDDDLCEPGFYAAHVAAHAAGDVSASVSRRFLLAEDGRRLATFPLPAFADPGALGVKRLGAELLFPHCVPGNQNFLGEITNCVLSPAAARLYARAQLGGMPCYGLCDIGTLLAASTLAPLAFIGEHLGGFRTNPQQSSAQRDSFGLRCGHLAWIALAVAAWRGGRIDASGFVAAITAALYRTLAAYPDDAAIEPFVALFERHGHDLEAFAAAFEARWRAFLEADRDAREVPLAGPLFDAGPTATATATAALAAPAAVAAAPVRAASREPAPAA